MLFHRNVCGSASDQRCPSLHRLLLFTVPSLYIGSQWSMAVWRAWGFLKHSSSLLSTIPRMNFMGNLSTKTLRGTFFNSPFGELRGFWSTDSHFWVKCQGWILCKNCIQRHWGIFNNSRSIEIEVLLTLSDYGLNTEILTS
jgi:hypothetical protein